MSLVPFNNKNLAFYFLLFAVVWLSAGCNSTKHVAANQHLLRKNKIVLKSDKVITNRGEMRDYLTRLIIQKPNTYVLKHFPLKLWIYNKRYNKLKDRSADSLPHSAERPAILDTMLVQKSVQNMKSYMLNQGYFFAKIKDTIIYSGRKAYVTYTINAGDNFLINRVNYDVDDSGMARLLRKAHDGTELKKGREFSNSIVEEERSRLTRVAHNNGYYRFTQESITFKIDTFDRSLFRVAENPFENAINFLSQAKGNKKPTLDIDVIVRMVDNPIVYTQYSIANVTVYPDFTSAADLTDNNLDSVYIDGTKFKYHTKYVRPRVLYEHIFLNKGNIYSQADNDKTYVKLNELGIFQYMRIDPRENTQNKNTLDLNILLSRTKKYDFSPSLEFSSGSTYALGQALGVNFKDRNFCRGANLLSITANGGFEMSYNDYIGTSVPEHFNVLTWYYNLRGSIDFPKFLAPVASSLFTNGNLPHTIVGGGENVIDRLNYFTMANTSANFTYNWRETQTKTWTLSPAFINLIRVTKSDSFAALLATNDYLRNSYKETFIEGENISFTFDDMGKRMGKNYSYLRLSLEEAGGLLGAINQLGVALNDLYKIDYSQYTKLDFDGRHYFTFPRSVFAFRFYGGVGAPYGQSSALPYIKQYFAGGAYSLRGWKIRTLGPGAFIDLTNRDQNNQIDRTGDIKLEMNGEYRFPITPLFAGAVKMNGAIFADAGNIWLAQKNASYPDGEFNFGRLGQDIAADMGVGGRFDIASFLTVRLDFAIPVKKPYVYKDYGWVIHEIDFGSSTWRAQNINFNVSIGYPF